MQTYNRFISDGRRANLDGGSLDRASLGHKALDHANNGHANAGHANLGLADFFRALRKRRLLAFMTFCAIFAITLGVASRMTPTYDASAVLLVGSSAADRQSVTAAQISDTTVSLAEIGGSEEVVRDAINKVGLARLLPPEKDATQGKSIALTLISNLQALISVYAPNAAKGFLPPYGELQERPTMDLDHAIPLIRKSLSVKAEPNSDIINVTFHHKDPVVAADFVNAVSAAFIDRQLNISTQPGAADFYWKQVKVFSDAVDKESKELNAFMVTNGVYDIDSQRQLLLTRLNGLSTALFDTRSSIASKEAFKVELIEQLRKLAPVTKSEFVSGLVDSFAAAKGARAGEGEPRSAPTEPPLLMVKVFQDSMVMLFKLKAELKGLEGLEEEQTRQVAALSSELTNLSKKQATFMELKQAVAENFQNEVKYKERAVEEEMSAKANEAKLSSVKVVQKANYPFKSNLPDHLTICLVGLIGGLLGALMAVLAAEFVFPGNRKPLQQPQWSPVGKSAENYGGAPGGSHPQVAAVEMDPVVGAE